MKELTINFRAILLFAFLIIAWNSRSQTIPYLKNNGNITQLIVHDKPFLMLGAELHNSSASGHEYMQGVWPMIKKYHVNTVLANISWELFEPQGIQFLIFSN